RHRDRRDPDAAHDGAVRRRESRGPGHRPAGGRAAGPGRLDGPAGPGAPARDAAAAGRVTAAGGRATGADRGGEIQGLEGVEGVEGVEGLEGAVPWWDPDADASVSPDTDSV